MEDAPLSREAAKVKLNRCMEEGRGTFETNLRTTSWRYKTSIAVSKSGAITMAPEPDIRTGRWEHRIEGITADDCRITVVFTFQTDLAVVITVFKRNS